MDLRITIQDENNDVLGSAVVYQDGSDSDGVERIVSYVRENFQVDSSHMFGVTPPADLTSYIADYINEELDRDNNIDFGTIQNAIEAFNAGAR